MQPNDGRPPENPDEATLVRRAAAVAPRRRVRGLVVALAALAVLAVLLLVFA